MEILKKTTTIIFALIICITTWSQSTEEIQKAFKSSYSNEYKNDLSAAINDLQKVYKADNYEVTLRLGWLYYSNKKFTTSMDYYKKAIDLKQYSVEARLGFIKPASELKKYDETYKMYESILKIDPYNSVANYWVGVSYYSLKQYDIAAKYFELVVNMYPFDYDANHMLAWTYLSLNKIAEAKILFNLALMNRPGDSSALEGLKKCN